MVCRFVCLCLLLICTPAIGEINLSHRPARDWPLVLKQIRDDVSLSDIQTRAGKTTGTWRFTYTLSLALDFPEIVTIEELEDGSARVLVTTENRIFQNYRMNEYERQWACGLPEDEQSFIHCPAPQEKPDVEQYPTEELSASKDDIARLRILFAAVPVCEEPDTPKPSDPNRVVIGLDGSDWYFETADGGRYCMAHRWSPSAGDIDPKGEAFRQLGLYMALLAQGRVYPM